MTVQPRSSLQLATSRPCLPHATPHPPTRSHRGSVVGAAFRRGKQQVAEEEEEDPETKTTFLGGIFGGNKSGTQRLKAGQPSQTPQASKTSKSKAGTPRGFLQNATARIGRKEQNMVFVAGATGRLGLRVVRELLLAGFKVRAGARNTQKAQSYVEVATNLGLLPNDAAKRLQIVPVDLEDPSSIAAAIGNATRIVQAIGAADNKALDFGAPKRIDGQAAIDLVNAAVEAGVTQYVMVTSLGTGKFGWPASALNLFGGILIQKRRAEKVLESSGLNYTIVRPGGMEKPGDDYKRLNNVCLSTADKLFGGQVSRLQVAELITSALSNPELANNKVLEVVAESSAPKLDYAALLQDFGSDSSTADYIEEEDEEGESAPVAPPKPIRRTPKKRPSPRQKFKQDGELTGNQSAIAEGVAQKEIDMKLKKDAPEPSAKSKNIAEDIAKAEIAIDSGKESPTRKWFGFGRSKAEDAEESAADENSGEAASTSTALENAVQAPIEAVETTAKSLGRKGQDLGDIERLNTARAKSAEDRAKREQEFLANLEAQRQEEAKKKKQAAEKREREALEKSRKDRDALFRKQEQEAQSYREQTAKWTAAVAERVAADRQAKRNRSIPAAPAAEVSVPDTSDAIGESSQGPQEARKWIEEWRTGQASGSNAETFSNGSTPQSDSLSEQAESKSQNGASSSSKEVQAWIEDWRSRTGAKS